MTTQKNGEIDWEQDTSGGDRKNTRDLYLKLDSGPNVIRVITKPHQYLTHRYKREGDPGFGNVVKCSNPSDGQCPLCAEGNKTKLRWLIGVLHKKTQATKILDVSYAVFSQIKNLASNTDVWGDPQKYDINIVVNKNGGATGYYSVQPVPHKPLTAQEQMLKDSFDISEMVRLIQPLTSAQVKARIEKLNSFTPGGQAPKAQPQQASTPTQTRTHAPAAVVAPVKQSPVDMSSEDDDGDDFANYAPDAS